MSVRSTWSRVSFKATDSLFIFRVLDLSIDVSRVLKSSQTRCLLPVQSWGRSWTVVCGCCPLSLGRSHFGVMLAPVSAACTLPGSWRCFGAALGGFRPGVYWKDRSVGGDQRCSKLVQKLARLEMGICSRVQGWGMLLARQVESVPVALVPRGAVCREADSTHKLFFSWKSLSNIPAPPALGSEISKSVFSYNPAFFRPLLLCCLGTAICCAASLRPGIHFLSPPGSPRAGLADF